MTNDKFIIKNPLMGLGTLRLQDQQAEEMNAIAGLDNGKRATKSHSLCSTQLITT